MQIRKLAHFAATQHFQRLSMSSSTASNVAWVPPSSLSHEITEHLPSNSDYHIEFNGYLSNHVKHALIALDRLDAPPTRVQEYWDDYTALTPYNLPLKRTGDGWTSKVEPCNMEQWSEWRGKKVNWEEQVQLIRKLQADHDGDSKAVIRKLVPDLIDGISGGLTHGLIHLGWAIDADCHPWMIAEGLAYLNFCHLPISKPLESHDDGQRDALGSLRLAVRTWKEQNLFDTWIEPTKAKYDESFHPELVPAGFQWHLSKVLHEPHPTFLMQVPAWIRTRPLAEIWKDLYQTVTLIYLATRTNDSPPTGSFLILHMITSLWGLEQLCNVILDDPSSEDLVRSAIEQYWAMGLGLLATSNSVPTERSLDEAAETFVGKSEEYDWTDTVARGIAETEEHNIKLVYVCRELWRRYDHWSGFAEAGRSFTVTPNIGPQSTKYE